MPTRGRVQIACDLLPSLVAVAVSVHLPILRGFRDSGQWSAGITVEPGGT